MKAFEKILVPVDFSTHSEEAVRCAADLAKRYDAQLLLLYVYEPVVYTLPEGYVMYTPDQLTQLMAQFDRSLAEAKNLARANGVTRVESRLAEGQIASTIIETAQSGAFDLIVMGTHGRKGLNRLLMGSVAEKVLRAAPCPVLSVRAPE